MLFQSFKLYVSIDERKCIENCLIIFPTNKEDKDELLEFLSSYKCYQNPSSTNLKDLFTEISHQELIQKPRYIGNCFGEEFQVSKLPSEFKSMECFQEFYLARVFS